MNGHIREKNHLNVQCVINGLLELVIEQSTNEYIQEKSHLSANMRAVTNDLIELVVEAHTSEFIQVKTVQM